MNNLHKTKGNVWNNNRSQPKQKSGGSKATQLQPQVKVNKFKEAQEKFNNAIQKLTKDYDSSSEEEELASENLIEKITSNYVNLDGAGDGLVKTEIYLKDILSSGATVCLICLSRVKHDDQIWSCEECYCFFHLTCIQKWSKDSLFQKKQALEDLPSRDITLSWGCPKCRFSYNPKDIPYDYLCFCKKTSSPKYVPLLAPHSCGEICKKKLKPECGHNCLLLCHPGPCPPCPVIVTASCYCGTQPSRPQRCYDKSWSCNEVCKRPLLCGKHKCTEVCHPNECKPCPKKSIQKCICQSQQKLRDCASPVWNCDKVCGKLLECGNHYCAETCHSGVCDACDLTKPRTCPCGKLKCQLPCPEETVTCQDTCSKILDCGQHFCNLKCHKGDCGKCLEIVEKRCQCGQHLKEIQCSKLYFCGSKCKNMRDCNRHPCNKKCCDGNCPPCEKACEKYLSCRNHKCTSVCHRGPCYPCNLTEIVSCNCGATTVEVPCGRKSKTRPPKCFKLCSVSPDCHHNKREAHRCHFGDCPSCKQICNKKRATCDHFCPVACHSSVLINVESQKASMPWEQIKPYKERRCLPCPKCVVPVFVTCLGDHEKVDWPCHLAKPSSCGRPCGRSLLCGNHTCSLPCHTVEFTSGDASKAGTNCENCPNECNKPRPDDCQHTCPKPCHPGACPPCKQMIRIKCHCGITQPFVACYEWSQIENRENLQSCGNQCPKNYDCGHRCRENCHSGMCPASDLCKKKVKVYCKCKRIKKEFSCEVIRKNSPKVDCDEICNQLKDEAKKQQELLLEKKRKHEEIHNQKELEKYQKIFEGKKKYRDRKNEISENQPNFIKKYYIYFMAFLGVLAALFMIFFN